MKRKLKGSFTVEAAVVVPIILFVFAVLIQILFYYHDKNILMSVAHETASMGSSRETFGEEELEQHFEKQIKGKLLAFDQIEKKIQIDEKIVKVTCKARSNSMVIHVEYKISRTNPEDYIRNIRKLN